MGHGYRINRVGVGHGEDDSGGREKRLAQRNSDDVGQVRPRNMVRKEEGWKRGRSGHARALGHERASGKYQGGSLGTTHSLP